MAEPMPTTGTPLFAQVSFHVIVDGDFDAAQAQAVTDILLEQGATELAPPSKHGKVPSQGLTHVISTTIDFEAYEELSDKFISIVTPAWVDASIAKKRLANPKQHSPDPRLFYSGLVVCTADLPEHDKDAIIGGIIAMGGIYSGSISKLVTHLVALSMEPQACQVARTKNLSCKIVLPHWFGDCLRLGRKIDEAPYLLPDPDLISKKASDHIATAVRPDLGGALSPLPGPLPQVDDPPSKLRQQLNIFDGKKVMLSKDLNIADHLCSAIEEVIEKGLGKVVDSVHDADIFVCHYRDGQDFVVASLAGKTVGNLPWLYYLFTHNTWTSPLKRLLHFPIARNGLPGTQNFRISLSNYNGEARVYLENLAKAAGCEFTKTMKQDNTHLITAHTASEKCEAAKEWNIHVINHLWLEESYAKWQIQSLSNPRYTHFPSRTNLSEVVGQTPIDKDAIQRHFLATSTKSKTFAERGPEKKKAAKVISQPKIATGGHEAGGPGHDEAGRLHQHHDQTPSKKLPSIASRVKTPRGGIFSTENKENSTPSTTGSRSAKDKAAARIHDLGPDIELFQRETKRVGGVVFGGRPKENEIVKTSRKRSESAEDETASEEDQNPREAKKPRQSRAPPRMRMLVTGYSRWSKDMKTYAKERSRLRALGILLVTDPKNCHYLAAPNVIRTQKFCCAVANAPTVLSTTYLEACIEADEYLDPENYLLDDPVGEAQYGIKLEDVLARARTSKGRMLQGQTVWVTDGPHDTHAAYKAIIEANGGTCSLYRGRVGNAHRSSTVDSGGSESENEDEWAYLVSGVTKDEAKLWPKFRLMAKSAGFRASIVRSDWILDLALSQRMPDRTQYECTDAEVASHGQAT